MATLFCWWLRAIEVLVVLTLLSGFCLSSFCTLLFCFLFFSETVLARLIDLERTDVCNTLILQDGRDESLALSTDLHAKVAVEQDGCNQRVDRCNWFYDVILYACILL